MRQALRALRSRLSQFGPVGLAFGLCGATAMLVWLGYQARGQSAQRAQLLLDRHVREQLALLWAGVTQDMRGAHATVIAPLAISQPPVEPPYDLAEAFARGFARFPYPESFVVWRGGSSDDGLTYVFNRAERLPRWHVTESVAVPYPVSVLRNPAAVSPLVMEARRRAVYGQPSALFETELDGSRYQVVVSFQYHTDHPERLVGLVGFTVNLNWVRDRYFTELTRQIAGIGGLSSDVSLEILDEGRRSVTATSADVNRLETLERAFPLSFADRSLLGSPRDGTSSRMWTARASAVSTSPLAAAVVSPNGGFLIMSAAAVAAVVGLLLTLRGMRVAAELAKMKSDFVSTVTHELKTPLTIIRLLADTLASGRYDTKEAVRQYAVGLSRESRNLNSLIDHLLTYARLAHGRQLYTFEAVDAGELIDDVVQHFHTLLTEEGFTVTTDVAPDLPHVWGDRMALVQMLDNLVDNAIKYSGASRTLGIHASTADRGVVIGVEDQGVGIHQDDVELACDRFFRGRNVTARGTGLGLAIARQIVDDHKGRLSIASSLGAGTRVEVTLPAHAAA